MGESSDFFSLFFHSSPTLMMVGLTQLREGRERERERERETERETEKKREKDERE